MKKHFFKILLLILGVWLLGGIFICFRPPREPVYEGKSLHLWLEDLEKKREYDRAEQAIRHIGTDALPFLVQMTGAKDSDFEKQLEKSLLGGWGHRNL